jgi:arabinan endo-1,5-alpha-L-arabinosidase
MFRNQHCSSTNFARITTTLLLFFFFQNSSAQSGGDTTTKKAATYQNPVFNHDFPDPNLIEAGDGYFYAYSTQVSWKKEGFGSSYIIPILRSTDLMRWDTVGAALEKKPDWKSEGGIWAPDAAYYKGRYFLYYSFSTWGDPDPGIGVATAQKPEGPFADHGKLFLSKEIGVPNSIDAFSFVERRKPYLVWGSFHGIYGVKLSKDGTKIKGEKFPLAGTAYEGSLIYKRDGWYYYFGSVGTCCEGAKSTYQVKVGRSKKFKGPYLDKDGKPLLQNGGTLLLQKNEGAEGFIGPGHNGDLVTDKKGQTWMVYHAFDKQNPAKGRVMLLDKIDWVDGWPVMAGVQPSVNAQAGPVF